MTTAKPFEPKAGELLRHLVRRRRYELGLSRAHVDVLSGLRPEALIRIESGRTRFPDRETLLLVSAALGIPYMDLFRALQETRRMKPPLPPRRAVSRQHLEARRLVGGADPVWRPGRCGTPRGGAAHDYYRERLCDPCRAARSEYVRSRRPSLHRPLTAHRNQWGYVQVRPTKGGLWRAYVSTGGPQLWGDYFADPELAARIRDRRAMELLGTAARLNFPESPENLRAYALLMEQPAADDCGARASVADYTPRSR
jgi:hypothetical protein